MHMIVAEGEVAKIPFLLVFIVVSLAMPLIAVFT